MWIKKKIQKCVKGARKGIFYPFSHPLHIFCQNDLFFLIHGDQKYSIKQFEIFP